MDISYRVDLCRKGFDAPSLDRCQSNSRTNGREFLHPLTDRPRDFGLQHHPQGEQAGSAMALRAVNEYLARTETADDFTQGAWFGRGTIKYWKAQVGGRATYGQRFSEFGCQINVVGEFSVEFAR